MDDITISVKTLAFVCGAIGTVIGTIKVLNTYIKGYVNKVTESNIESKVNEVVTEKTSEIEKTISDTLSIVKELQTSLSEYTEVAKKDFEDIKKTLCDSLREKITTMHMDCTRAGYISEHQMFIVNEWWDDYSNRLNGNSFVEDLVDDLRELYKSCHKDGNKKGGN